MTDKEAFSSCANNLRGQTGKKAAPMTEPSQVSPLGAFLLGVFLIAAGLAGNYVKFPIFLNAASGR